jgi:hypothetical protein
MGGVEERLPEAPEPDEKPAEVERPRHVPMRVDPYANIETGRVAAAVGRDGLPIMVGEAGPPEEEDGLTDENFVCAGGASREPCESYVAILTRAEGVAKGFGELRAVRRYCKWLATATEPFEITGVDIYACSARRPVDSRSLAVLDGFERRQKEMAAEAKRASGKVEY